PLVDRPRRAGGRDGPPAGLERRLAAVGSCKTCAEAGVWCSPRSGREWFVSERVDRRGCFAGGGGGGVGGGSVGGGAGVVGGGRWRVRRRRRLACTAGRSSSTITRSGVRRRLVLSGTRWQWRAAAGLHITVLSRLAAIRIST